MFLNLVDKKLLYLVFLVFSYYVILYSTPLQQDLAFERVDFNNTRH